MARRKLISVEWATDPAAIDALLARFCRRPAARVN